MQHNKVYTFIFVCLVSIISSFLLAFAYTKLKNKHAFNVELDRKKNIIECLGIDIDNYNAEDIIREYDMRIKEIVTITRSN